MSDGATPQWSRILAGYAASGNAVRRRGGLVQAQGRHKLSIPCLLPVYLLDESAPLRYTPGNQWPCSKSIGSSYIVISLARRKGTAL